MNKCPICKNSQITAYRLQKYGMCTKCEENKHRMKRFVDKQYKAQMDNARTHFDSGSSVLQSADIIVRVDVLK